MPYAYVYSPFTAQVLGVNTYCSNGNPHNSGFSGYGMCCPVDIGGVSYVNNGAFVVFYCNSTIASIRTIQRSDFCVGNYASPLEDAVFVEMYSSANAIGYIGTMFYGHLAFRVPNGIKNNPSGLVLGRLPGPVVNTCYPSPHIHVGRNTSGQTRSLACYQVLRQGIDWFYRWVF